MEETLNILAKRLFDARRVEEDAKKLRIAAEEAVALYVETGDRGSKTVDAGDGIKVTIKRGLNYKADIAAIRAIDVPDLPLKFKPATYELAETAYEALRETNPALFNAIAQHVTTTPKKVSVELKLA